MAFAFMSYKYRWKSDNNRKSNQKKKQRIGTKNEAKKIQSDNFTSSNIEYENIHIAILEKLFCISGTPILFSPSVQKPFSIE